MPTPLNTINIAKISQFLASNEIAKKGLYGGGIDLQLPRKLYLIRKNLEWLYNLDNTDDTLQTTANYLYALCGKFALTADAIQNSGGSVAPINPLPSTPDQLNFVVAASGTPLIDGQTFTTFTDFIGYNLVVDKNGQPLTQITSAPFYYTWDKVSGLFTLNVAAALGDEFQITPT